MFTIFFNKRSMSTQYKIIDDDATYNGHYLT